MSTRLLSRLSTFALAALVAMAIAVPLSLVIALFLVEMAPPTVAMPRL